MSSATTLGVPSASQMSVSQVSCAQPNMRDTITGWSEKLVFVLLYKKIVNRENVDERREFTCMGVVQPFSSQGLKIKPEGQRSWKWWMLHVSAAIDLPDGAEFILREIRYKIMSRKPYSRNGYFEYELVESFSIT